VAPFKAVTVKGSSSGGPGLGSRNAAEGMGRGPRPDRWAAGSDPLPAGGWRASAWGRAGIGAPMGGTPAQCRPVVKTGSSLFKRIRIQINPVQILFNPNWMFSSSKILI
jgi:hypothetical protein